MSGVWCEVCEDISATPYRCDACGHDLAGEGTTVGRQET